MTTTTEYGTWADVASEVTVEDTITTALGDHGAGFDVDAIVSDYRAAINAALPTGVVLAGDDFFGPYYDRVFPGFPVNGDGALDLKAIVDSVDLWEIVEIHTK
jgi:hypothetical protein